MRRPAGADEDAQAAAADAEEVLEASETSTTVANRKDVNTIFSPQMSPLQQHVKNKTWGNVMSPLSPHSTLRDSRAVSSKDNDDAHSSQQYRTKPKVNVVERISNREVTRRPHAGLARWENLYQTSRLASLADATTSEVGANNTDVSPRAASKDLNYDNFNYESVTESYGNGFVLRVMSIEQIPLRLSSTTGVHLHNRDFADMNMSILVSATLFDDKTGAVMGRTVRGMPVRITRTVNSAVPSLRLNTELFYITRPRKKTLVIAELVLRCTDAKGVVVEETGLGWAALPAADTVIAGRGKMMTSMRSGTPRYLMFRDCIAGAPPPAMLGSATLIFALDNCEMLKFASDFIRVDSLYTTDAIIPGLVGEHRPKTRVQDGDSRGRSDVVGSTRAHQQQQEEEEDVLVMPLAQPVICPIWQLCMRSSTMVLPRGMHGEIIACLAHRFGERVRTSVERNLVKYTLRLATHNGHRFVGGVGEMATTHHFSASTGDCIIQVDPEAYKNGFNFLCPGDANFVCIVELWITDALVDMNHDESGGGDISALDDPQRLLTSTTVTTTTTSLPASLKTKTVDTTSVRTPGSSSTSMCVGWVPFDPFHSTSVFASTSRLTSRSGNKRGEEYTLHLRSGGTAWPRGDLVFNWRDVMLLKEGNVAHGPELRFTLTGMMVRDVQVAPIPSELQSDAAIVIQKHMRGHRVRRNSSLKVRDVKRVLSSSRAAVKQSTADDDELRRRETRMDSTGAAAATTSARPSAEEMQPKPFVPRARDHGGGNRDENVVELKPFVIPQKLLIPGEAGEERKEIETKSVVDAGVGDFSVRDSILNEKLRENAGVQYEPDVIDGGMLEPQKTNVDPRNTTRLRDLASALYELHEPSRALKTLLHQSGIGIGLPKDTRGTTAKARVGAPPSLENELRDNRVNEFILQLIAVHDSAPVGTHANGHDESHDGVSSDTRLGSSLFFTFSFYDYAKECTEVARLVRPALPATAADIGVRLLEATSRTAAGSTSESVEGGPAIPARGLVHKFTVTNDNAASTRDERRRLFEYLLERRLQIDVWDARTMLHVGTASVPLTGLLRQGRDVGEVLHEAQILRHGVYVAETLGLDPSDSNDAVRNLDDDVNGLRDATVGSLVVRFVNFARESEASAAHSSFVENKAPNVSKVRPMYDLEDSKQGVSSVVLEAPDGRYAALSISQLEEFERRKLARATRLHQLKQGGGDVSRNASGVAYSVLREKILNDVTTSRSRSRHKVIVDTLRSTFCKRLTIRPSYGEAVYIEHDVVNPYGSGVTLRVMCNSDDVRFVRDAWEWKHHRAARGLLSGGGSGWDSRVDDSIEDCVFADDVFFLHPHETTKMALKFQSFNVERFTGSAASGTSRDTSTPVGDPVAAGPLAAYVCKVKLVNPANKQVVSMLELCIEPRRMVIGHSLRFHAGEHEIWKARFGIERLLVRSTTDLEVLSKALSDGGMRPVAKCSDRRVACELSEVKAGGVGSSSENGGHGTVGHDCHLRYKCGNSNEAISFYVLIYTDQYMSQVLEILHFVVHPLRQVDVKSVTGQTSNTAVVIYGRGTRSRKVRFFASHPELRVTSSPVVLSPSSIVELPMTFCPRVSGRCNVFVNVMDVQANELIETVLVRSETVNPVVSSTFDLLMRLGSVLYKKIKLRNPYQEPRRFTLKTSHPQLLTFREDHLDMMPAEVRFVSMCFDTSGAARAFRGGGLSGRHQVLVFVNDEEDRNEECYKIDLTVLSTSSAAPTSDS